MKIILRTDPKLEYRNESDLFIDVYYDNSPFTGIVEEELEQTEYIDGYAHGKYILKYKDGIIDTESIYEKGEEIESESFYQTGEKKSIINAKECKLWSKTGILLLEIDFISGIRKSYFLDGTLKSHSNKNDESYIAKYYNKQGNWIFTQLPHDMEKLKTVVNYNDKEIIVCYFDLIAKEKLPELEYNELFQQDENQRLHLIWMWLWDVFDENKKLYFSIINDLMTHSDVDVLKNIASIIAIHKFEKFVENKNEMNAACYSFIEEYRAYQNKYHPNRELKKVII